MPPPWRPCRARATREASRSAAPSGILTAELGRRCDDLLAVEPVAAALDEARARNADQPHIRFAPMFVPAQWPEESFDLVVLSEVIDYLGAEDVVALARRVCAALEPGGDVVLVHWVGKKRGPPAGDEASDRFIAAAGGALRGAAPGAQPRLSARRPDAGSDGRVSGCRIAAPRFL